MSETKFLYGAAVQGIQGFIFQTNKLREIVGASELVEEICTDKFIDIFTQLELKYDPESCILRAAGNIKYIFSDRKECEKVVKVFPKEISNFAPGITVSQAVVEFDGINFQTAVNELENKLRTQRNKPVRSATLGMMGIERSRQTGLPVVLVKNETRFGKYEELHLDAGTRAKLYSDLNGERKQTTLSLCNKAFVQKKEFEKGTRIDESQVALNIEEITKNNDWIAIIHADGNGLGQVVQKVGSDPQKFKCFSEKLDEATAKSAVAAYESVMGSFENSKKNPGFIPIRPIVLGGDDLTVICRADLALDYVSKFINQFEANTNFVNNYNSENPKELKIEKLTACAGIAYIKSSFPFYYGYELAEDLCSQAKKDAKKDLEDGELAKSCLMFHKVQDSFTEDWNDIAKRELTPQDNISFQFGPYYVNEKKDESKWLVNDLLDASKILNGDNKLDDTKFHIDVKKINPKEGNAVKSHLRNWLSLLHDNPEMANQKLERLKSMTTEEYREFVEEITFKYDGTADEVQKTPVYDILAIHTINTQKTKEDK